MNDLAAKRELALEAKEIIESKAFEAAKAALRDRLVNNLTGAQTTEQKLDLVAKIKMIEEFTGELRALINDYNAGVRRNQSPAGLNQARSNLHG